MERAYTVKELDALRIACRNKWLFGFYNPSEDCMGRSYQQQDLDRGVEERVRTHMLAGHTAEDLIASEAEDVG